MHASMHKQTMLAHSCVFVLECVCSREDGVGLVIQPVGGERGLEG